MAIASRGNPPEEGVERVHRGLEAMRHRGPDGRAVWSRGNVVLGHARLALVDLANGQQPVGSEDGAVRAVVNGEFYNEEPLRQNLEQRGHCFASDSDSELLVHLYEEYGLECFARLRGEFAFILWDGHRLVAARDRFGIKPLHVARMADEWLLASEAKALFAAGVPARWNARAFGHAIVHQYLPEGESLFYGIRQVRPGHCLVIEDGAMREWTYWEPPGEGEVDAPPEEIRQALEEAVAVRLRGAVPPACTLSGGLDSTAVATMAARAMGRPASCFTIRFDAPGYDEGPLVRADVQGSALEVSEIPVSRRQLVTELERAVWYSEGLAINGQLVGKFLLSRAIHDAGFKAVLAGEGADEAFLGYAHLQYDHLRLGGGTEGLAALVESFAQQRSIMLPESGEEARKTAGRLDFVPAFLLAKLATGRLYRPLLSPEMRALIDDGDLLEETMHGLDAVLAPPRPSVRQSAVVWTRLALANYILRTLGDGAEMAHSVEARLPFLDHQLFEQAAGLPVQACLAGQQSKAVLREALAGVIPEAVRLRPKHPFLAPPLLTDGDPVIRDFILDTLDGDNVPPFFDRKAIRPWLEELFQVTPEKQMRQDPVLTTLLSATLLQKGYHLT